MRTAPASDHAGFAVKQEIESLLSGSGHETT